MATTPRKVILDTDPGVDDALALLFALSHPGIRVEAVTCMAGNVSLPKVVRNGLGLLQLANRTDIPLAAGAFNIWCDPEAVQIVYESGARITQVGLDVTHQACLTRSDVAELARRRPP